MLAAEVHGKLSVARPPDDRMEDILTSYVFSLFRYLDDLQVPTQFVLAAKNCLGDSPEMGEIRAAQVLFWPRFFFDGTRSREPDVLLLLDTSTGQWAINVECKYYSGLSNVEVNGAAQGIDEDRAASKSLGNQLVDEYCAIRCKRAHWKLSDDEQQVLGRCEHRAVLYVTGHHEFPLHEIEDAMSALRSQRCYDGQTCDHAQEIFWVGWRTIHRILTESTHSQSLQTRAANLLSDLAQVLEIRDLTVFNGFHPLDELERYSPVLVERFFNSLCPGRTIPSDVVPSTGEENVDKCQPKSRRCSRLDASRGTAWAGLSIVLLRALRR